MRGCGQSNQISLETMTEKQFAVFLFGNFYKSRPIRNSTDRMVTFVNVPHRVRDEILLRAQKAGLPYKEYLKHLGEVFVDIEQ